MGSGKKGDFLAFVFLLSVVVHMLCLFRGCLWVCLCVMGGDTLKVCWVMAGGVTCFFEENGPISFSAWCFCERVLEN